MPAAAYQRLCLPLSPVDSEPSQRHRHDRSAFTVTLGFLSLAPFGRPAPSLLPPLGMIAPPSVLILNNQRTL
jgi:hypothetical protein